MTVIVTMLRLRLPAMRPVTVLHFTHECESQRSQQRELIDDMMTVESHRSAMNGRPCRPVSVRSRSSDDVKRSCGYDYKSYVQFRRRRSKDSGLFFWSLGSSEGGIYSSRHGKSG